MEFIIYSITSSSYFHGIFGALQNYFGELSSSGEEVCYLLTWFLVVASILFFSYLVTRVISFLFRGKL